MYRLLFYVSIIQSFFLFASCYDESQQQEIIWDKISKSRSGSIHIVEYSKYNLASQEQPWYIMVSVNTLTKISFCGQILFHPPQGKAPGSKNLFVEAKENNCELKISIFGRKQSIVLNPVVYGSISDLWQYQIKKDGFLILFGFFYIIIGIFALYIFFLKQSNFQYLSFSTLLLSVGIYSLSIGNELFGMLIPSFPNEYWIPTLLASLYSIPGSLLWFLSYLLRSNWRKRFRITGLGYLVVVSFILFIFQVLEIEFDSILTAFHIICILFLFVFFPPFFSVLRNPQYNLTRVLYGFVFFLIFAFLELGISFFTKNLEVPLLSFGLFCFLLPLGEFSIHQFFRLEAQIQNVKDIQNLRQDRTTESTKSRISNINETELTKKIQNLLENEKIFLDENLTLRKLAKRLQIREDQVSYLINHNFKVTFTTLLKIYRINEAKILLKKKDTNILNIAYSVGFQSKSNFNSIFKSFTKMTPSEFRKQESDESI
jgi:AraC-like DNA-binding protein